MSPRPPAASYISPTEPPRARIALARLAALAFAAIGITMMIVAAPKVPYADPWRFLATFLSEPFPHDVLTADNGHREVLPNLVRIAELQWLDGNQWLQILVGVFFAGATTSLLLSAFRAVDQATRPATTTLLCIGLFWLGNDRKLAHGNESVPLFLILFFLALGLRLLVSVPGNALTQRRVWSAAALALLATLTFGTGAACFPAFLVVLFLQRAPLRRWLPLVVVAAVGAAAVFVGNKGATVTTDTPPLVMLEQLLRWLGAPFVWVFSPLLDVQHAARLPTALLSSAAGFIAERSEAEFGPALAARYPAAAFGALGVLWLLWATLRARLSATPPARALALGLAWCGLTAGILTMLARSAYFQHHPGQLTAARYVPWSMLMWTGLALSFVAHSGRRAGTAMTFALAIAVMFAPSQVWCGRNAFKLQETAELTALGAAVGALDQEFPLVETQSEDLLRAVPLLRARGKAMFAWPETALLGKPVDAASGTEVAVRALDVVPGTNRFEGPCCRVRFTADSPNVRLVLLDDAGIAQGLALGSGDAFRGWLRTASAPGRLRAIALRK